MQILVRWSRAFDSGRVYIQPLKLASLDGIGCTVHARTRRQLRAFIQPAPRRGPHASAPSASRAAVAPDAHLKLEYLDAQAKKRKAMICAPGGRRGRLPFQPLRFARVAL